MEIDFLANRSEFIPENTRLLYGQWGALYRAGGISESRLRGLLLERAVDDRLPICVVALSGRELLGTGSIKLSEPGTKAGPSPWLAGMFVKEAYRRHGAGAAIVRALQATASDLGVTTLYLSVGTENDAAKGLYSRLGWTALEQVNS